MDMEIHQLRYFCAVARTGSFTKAAELEQIAQPSLSQQIQKLETGLGAPLFDRRGRAVRLTQCGELLLPQAQAVLRQLTDAKASVQELATGVRGRLTVGSIPTIMPYWLAPRVREFSMRYPDVELRLVENITRRLVEGLQSGRIDVAVLALPVQAPDLVCAVLFKDPIRLALPPDHDLCVRPEVSLAAVKSERLLILREGHCFRENALTACRRARFEPSAVFESDQLASVYALVEAGFGVSLVPAMSISGAGKCRLMDLSVEASRRVGYAQVRRPFAPAAQRAFIEWLKESRG